MSATAEHCNRARLAARNVQDASLKLYLCLMLRDRPVISEALVLSLGGDKFFSAYLPEFGFDTRCVQAQNEGVHEEGGRHMVQSAFNELLVQSALVV